AASSGRRTGSRSRTPGRTARAPCRRACTRRSSMPHRSWHRCVSLRSPRAGTPSPWRCGPAPWRAPSRARPSPSPQSTMAGGGRASRRDRDTLARWAAALADADTTMETHAMDLAAAQSVRDTIPSPPVEDLDPSDGYRFRDDTIHLVFERLRREDPVHWSTKTRFGSFWSVTRYKDIMAVDSNHRVFSSDAFAGGSVTLSPRKPEEILPSFIEMDPPRHDEQRKAVSPIVAPHYLAEFEELIRSRVIDVVESLPVGEPFDWVQRVSIDLTTKMLATLFDFPFEERHLLTWWSDIATGQPKDAE